MKYVLLKSGNFLSEIWKNRSLITLLAFNDVKLRYRNSVLGFLWSFLEPLLMLAVLYFVFTNIIRSDIENYPLYLLLSLVIWYMFSRATTMGQTSLIDKAGIIQKVYLRKEIVVVSSVLTSFIMMSFEFAAFAVFVVVFQFVPSPTIFFLPALLVILFILSLGISLILSVLTVKFRDMKFIWQVALQAGFFLSPIIYDLNMFPENIRSILQLNPLVPLLDTAHNVVLYDKLPTLKATAYMLLTTTALFFIGYIIFKINQKKIIEEI